MNDSTTELNKDKGYAKNALKLYLHHFLIPERTAILEDLICELDKEGFINIDWVEIY